MTKADLTKAGDMTRSVKVHRPRKQKTFVPGEMELMKAQLDQEGFVSFTIVPKVYNVKAGRFDSLKGHTITARAFSIEALEDALGRVEEACRG